MSNKIKTKYGSATFDKKRGYRITSRKENNHKKFVHLLVWEEHYGEIPDNAFVIFKDGNKKNYDISNLELKYHNESFETEFGKAVITQNGYIAINSGKNRTFIHRLVWEKYNGEIPDGYQIHHIDGNKLNNDISNLQLLSAEEHTRLHMLTNNPIKGKTRSLENKLNISKQQNKTGYFRVSKEYGKPYKKGFRYRYIYLENGKRKEIKSVNLDNLKEKVIEKGLPWIKL